MPRVGACGTSIGSGPAESSIELTSAGCPLHSDLETAASAALAMTERFHVPSSNAVGGFIIKVCSSGLQVLATVVSFEPDLLLPDIMTPCMQKRDRFDTRAPLRKAPRLQRVSIGRVTSQFSDAHKLRGRVAGFDGAIFKPFNAKHWSEAAAA